MEKKLYPLKFISIGTEKPWGGTALVSKLGKKFTTLGEDGIEKELPADALVAESWEIADMGFNDSPIENGFLAGSTISDVMETYMERVVGEKVFERYGTQYPVLVKFLDINDKLSLAVHPDDEIAAERYDSLGKLEVWYVLEADENAKVYLGFKEDTDPSKFYYACQNGTAGELLNVIKPHKGDIFIIKPGTVHSAEGKLLTCEIQESSDLSFRLYDWGRENNPATAREMQLEEAFDFINYGKYDPADYIPAGAKPAGRDTTTECFADFPQFTATKIVLNDGMHIYSDQLESFVEYICLEGEVSIQMADDKGVTRDYRIKKGETVLIPAECPDFILSPVELGSVLIEVVLHPEDEVDSYTGEDDCDCDDDHECDDPDCDCHEHGHHHGDHCNCGHHHHHS